MFEFAISKFDQARLRQNYIYYIIYLYYTTSCKNGNAETDMTVDMLTAVNQ